MDAVNGSFFCAHAYICPNHDKSHTVDHVIFLTIFDKYNERCAACMSMSYLVLLGMLSKLTSHYLQR